MRRMVRSAWPVCLLIVGMASVHAAPARGLAPVEPLAMHTLAPGVHVHEGAQADANTANKGDIANIGYIAGRDCVAVIDTGGSPRIGRALKQAIRQSTDKPVCYVINTHMHPDHVLGNRAFTDTDAEFVASASLAQALAARAQAYLASASNELGVETDRSWIVLPTRTVEDRDTLALGGRTLVLQSWPTGHTNNDLTVYDRKTQTLWLSDMLFVDRVPSLDGSLTGWIKSLDVLSKRNLVARVVPGHGPVPTDWRTAIDAEQEYLQAIGDGVRNALDNGHTIEYAGAHVAHDQKSRWLLFDAYHRRNVTTAYTELEWQ